MRRTRLALWTLLLALGAAAGEAQPAPPRLAVSVGPDWVGSMDAGGGNATLTAAAGGRFGLFETASTLSGGLGVSGALGVRLTGQLWTELTGRYHSARLETRVTRDVEAADQVAREAVQQVQIDGGLLWLPDRLRVTSRIQLFMTGGAGYLRQLHSTNTLVETGRGYYAGGGAVIELPTRQGGVFKASALRLDVRGALLQRGVLLDTRAHAAPAVWASLFLRF